MPAVEEEIRDVVGAVQHEVGELAVFRGQRSVQIADQPPAVVVGPLGQLVLAAKGRVGYAPGAEQVGLDIAGHCGRQPFVYLVQLSPGGVVWVGIGGAWPNCQLEPFRVTI